MKLLVNGDERQLPEGATVDDALAAAGAPESRRGIAVAVDGAVVPRAQWPATKLHEGQRVEVLQAVGGG